MADWTLALLDAAGVQQAALAGHSMGSLIALEAAGRAPERVTRLLMLGTAYPMAVPKALLELSIAAPLKAIDRVVIFSFSTLAAKPSYPGPGVWLRGAARQLMRLVLQRQGDAMLFHKDFAACDRYANGLQAAALLRCPAHLVLARDDQMTPTRATRELAAALKAQVHTVPAGHFLMQECPDGVLEAVRAGMGPAP
jgi:pimeloyl-ACP methyl ester carboxylesterase